MKKIEFKVAKKYAIIFGLWSFVNISNIVIWLINQNMFASVMWLVTAVLVLIQLAHSLRMPYLTFKEDNITINTTYLISPRTYSLKDVATASLIKGKIEMILESKERVFVYLKNVAPGDRAGVKKIFDKYLRTKMIEA